MRRDCIVLPFAGLVVGAIFSLLFPDGKQPLPAPVTQEQQVEPVTEEPVIDKEVIEELAIEHEPVTKDGTIVMYISDSCVWCVRWKTCELAKIRAAGWKFEEVRSPDGPWPRFDIYGRGKVFRHVGYMSMSELKQIVDKM